MDEFWITLIKIIIFLPFVLLCIYLSLKYGSSRLQQLQNGKHIKVLERVALSKDNSILVAKLGEKAYVITSTQGSINILKELTEEELMNIKEKSAFDKQFQSNIKDLYKKIKAKKEDKHE